MKQEKGNSQGFNTAEVLLYIILPQTYRNIVPTLLSQVITTIKDSSYFLRWSFWWARVDIASRASKKAPQGLFCPPDCTAGLTSCACRFFCSPLAGL